MLDVLTATVRRAGDDPETVAEILRSALPHTNLLSPAQMRPDTDRYRQHILHAEPGLSIVSLVWLPGQATCVHDHVSWCVVGVYQGSEHEIRYDLATDDDGGEYLAEIGTATNPAGSVTHLRPPGDIHEVRNASGGRVVSIHIYGADVSVLGSSIRRRYDLPIRRLS